jgi:hypothetical protein
MDDFIDNIFLAELYLPQSGSFATPWNCIFIQWRISMKKKNGKKPTEKLQEEERSEEMKSLDKLAQELGFKRVDPPKTVTIMFKK